MVAAAAAVSGSSSRLCEQAVCFEWAVASAAAALCVLQSQVVSAAWTAGVQLSVDSADAADECPVCCVLSCVREAVLGGVCSGFWAFGLLHWRLSVTNVHVSQALTFEWQSLKYEWSGKRLFTRPSKECCSPQVQYS